MVNCTWLSVRACGACGAVGTVAGNFSSDASVNYATCFVSPDPSMASPNPTSNVYGSSNSIVVGVTTPGASQGQCFLDGGVCAGNVRGCRLARLPASGIVVLGPRKSHTSPWRRA